MNRTTRLYIVLTVALALAVALPGMAVAQETDVVNKDASVLSGTTVAVTQNESDGELAIGGAGESNSGESAGNGATQGAEGEAGGGEGGEGLAEGNANEDSSSNNGGEESGADHLAGTANGGINDASGAESGKADFSAELPETAEKVSTEKTATDPDANAKADGSAAVSTTSVTAAATVASASSKAAASVDPSSQPATQSAVKAQTTAKQATTVQSTTQASSVQASSAKQAASSKTAATSVSTQAATSSQSVLPAGTYVLVAGTARGKVLDVEGASTKAGANVIIWDYNGGANQRWTVRYVGGWAVIYGIGGNVLEVAGSKARAGLNVRMGTWRGAASQKWSASASGQWIYLVSALGSSYRLDITGQSSRSGTNVEIWTSNATSAQRFQAQRATPSVPASAKVADGWYTMRSALSSSYNLDVTGCSAANGTALELWSSNSSSAQAFRLFRVGQYYRVEAGCGAGSYLDVEGGKVVPGTKAEVWRSTTNCTLFSLQYEKSLGGYRLVNVASGLALQPTSGKASQGARVTAERSVAGSKAQTFVLVSRPGLLQEGTYRISTNLVGGRAMGSKNASESKGAAVTLGNYDGAFTQKWYVSPVSGKTNTYIVESIATGYRLQAASSKGVTQQAAANNNSQWWVPSFSNGGYALKNVRTGQMLDVSGANPAAGAQVITWGSNNGANQRWSLSKVAAIESGIYEFRSAANTGYALDVEGSSQANGAKVELWKANGGSNQRWYYDASQGTLVSMSSGKALDIEGANKKSGTKALQWELNGGNNQKWTITYAGGGKFKIASKLGNSLVLTAAKTANGAQATSATDKSVSLQRWKPVKRDLTLSAKLKKSFSGIDMTNVRGVGIDVSFWNGTINWGAVKNSGVSFAIIRIGYGGTITDSQLVANVRGARAAGVQIGLYYYTTATSVAQARNEANHALNLMKSAGVTPSVLSHPVYLDMEEDSMAKTSNRSLLANIAKTFLGTMKSNGYKTGVYANLNWWNNYLTDSSFNSYERWIAQWSSSRCSYGGSYKVWQTSSTGVIPGISGSVDTDVMY